MDFEGATAAQYDAVIEDMELDGRLPAHALHHGAGSPDGRNWRVVDVWETPEDFERFAAEKRPDHGQARDRRADDHVIPSR